MADIRDSASVRQGIASKSRLYEAAENLRKVLYLSKSTDLTRAITTASGVKDIESSVTAGFASQKQDDALRDIVLGMLPARKEDVRAAGREIEPEAKNAAATSLLGVKSVSVFTPADFYDGILTGTPTDPKKKSEITHVRLTDTGQANNFSTRGAEYVAIFSNLIPSVELSKCVPYFNMKLIQNIPNDASVKMPFLTLDTFLGAVREYSKNSGDLRKQGSLTTTPVTPVDMPTAKLNTTISGMELFLAPQTLVTPGINAQEMYKSLRGVRALDPMQPLASIESINFDVSALSQNFMTTNTKIDMTIILHDKSRLAELSPLITPGVFPTVQAEIEWGWSHPEPGEFTSNQFAKFLNALKNKQVFCVNSATFNNRDATSLSIKLQLTGLGEWVASNTSVYTGKYVSYELIRAKMNQLFTIIDERAKEGYPAKQKFIGAYEQVIELSDWDTSDKWVEYEKYVTLSDLIDNVQNGLKQVDELVSFYSTILSGFVPKDTNNPATFVNLSTALRNDIRDALRPAKTIDSPYAKSSTQGRDESDASSSTSASPDLLTSYIQSLTNDIFNDDGDVAPPATPAGEAPTETGGTTGAATETPRVAGTITFGDAFYRLFCVPVSLTGIYDEIRVTMFDFNDHAGRMAGLNIGSFPMTATEVADAVLKNKMTAQRAAQEIIKLVNNAAAVPYGIKKALLDKQAAEDAISKEPDLTSEEGTKAREEVQSAFEIALQRIYEEKAKAGLAVSFEPKFDTPRVKMHTEVTPVLFGDTIKQVLNVFIFDGANTGYRGTNIITSIMQQDSSAVRVLKAGEEIPKYEGKILVVNQPAAQTSTKKTKVDDMPIVSIDRETAKKIVTLTMPTLRIGAEGSLITNASYSSSASGDLSNVNLLRGIKNSGGSSSAGSFPGVDADLFLIPATLTLTMPGMPIINRGQTYYVDFGTGTTLDNTYTVTSVKHSMKLGSFTTTVSLNPTSQGSIKSVASKLQTDLKILQKHASTKMTSTQST